MVLDIISQLPFPLLFLDTNIRVNIIMANSNPQCTHLTPLLVFLLLLVSPSLCYIDIEMPITTSSADIALNMPLTINNQEYHIAISLTNHQEYLVAPSAMPKSKHKKEKKNKGTELSATMHVWSLEGYTLEGWKRFFLQVFLFQDSKYSHVINFNLSSIKTTNKSHPLTNGLMTIGPQLPQNKIYQLIKQQTTNHFTEDVVSFYTVPGGKEIRMQLGGYQDQNARGYSNGVRYYQTPIAKSEDEQSWVLPVSKIVVAKERSNKWQCYNIPFSGIKPKLTIESQFIILPQTLKEDLQTSFETQNTECSFSEATSQLQCSNMSSIDEALTFLSLQLQKQVSLNISLYDLRDQYNTKQKLTSFFIKLGTSKQIQIGAPLLRGYYISLNLAQSSLLFSPLNRFSPQIDTAEIIRFICMFMMFMFMACAGIVVWQQWNMPKNTRHRFARNKDGVKLVAYQRPAEFEDDEEEID